MSTLVNNTAVVQRTYLNESCQNRASVILDPQKLELKGLLTPAKRFMPLNPLMQVPSHINMHGTKKKL